MKIHTTIKIIKTACGKTISYFLEEGKTARMHSTEGPALIYSKEENKASEYYIYGIKYSKSKWLDLVNQQKAVGTGEPINFDF